MRKTHPGTLGGWDAHTARNHAGGCDEPTPCSVIDTEYAPDGSTIVRHGAARLTPEAAQRHPLIGHSDDITILSRDHDRPGNWLAYSHDEIRPA